MESSGRSNNRQGETFKWMACKFYKDGDVNSCKHGSKCAFAHGAHEKIEKPVASDQRNNRGTKRSATSANLPSAMCAHFLKNSCNKGDSCRYSHDQEEFNKSIPKTFKTSLCTNYMGTGKCNRESVCGFAHGRYELRPFGYKGNFEEKIKEMPNWKTVECQYFMKTGQCRNADDCPFAHGNNELRMSKQTHFDPLGARPGNGDYENVGGTGSMCKFYLEGHCRLGRKCNFSHGMSNTPHANQMMDYTRDVTPATMRDVAEPIMSKDHLYNEFMSFLNQKFQGTGNFAAQNALAMEDPMNLAAMAQAQESAMLMQNMVPRREMPRTPLNQNFKSSRPQTQFGQQAAVRGSLLKQPQIGSYAAGSGGLRGTSVYRQSAGDTFDDIF